MVLHTPLQDLTLNCWSCDKGEVFIWTLPELLRREEQLWGQALHWDKINHVIQFQLHLLSKRASMSHQREMSEMR